MSLVRGRFRFRDVRVLGEGGLGIVHEIEITDSNDSLLLGSHWACKRLNAKWKQLPAGQERFEREIAAIRMMDHPMIVAFKGQNLPGEERFYVMPLYPSSVRRLLVHNPAGFPWRDVATFGANLAAAMMHAHQLGYIHRDLKPENILLDALNNPIIADWGLGYFIHQHSKVLNKLTKAGLGTEYYCSLEQWTTGKCDQTGDVYSLGVMLAELARGKPVPLTVGMGLRVDSVPGTGTGPQWFNAQLRQMTAVLPRDRPQPCATSPPYCDRSAPSTPKLKVARMSQRTCIALR